MKVLLTRPKGSNELMLRALNDKSIEAIETPLMEIKPVLPCQSVVLQLPQADKIIFISQHAVHQFRSLFNVLPDRCQIFAVGQRTRQALQKMDIRSVSVATQSQDSEGLLMLEQLKSVEGEAIIIVRGQGGREKLASALTERGADIHYCEVYQRVLPKLHNSDISKYWQQQGVDTILITSGEMLLNLLKLVESKQQAWIKRCNILVPSDRVLKIALNEGFTRVFNAEGASQSAMLSTIDNIIDTLKE
ncbi:uroporphyrinogen-III synthase [Shewanella sp. OPT22]|nr:uroporphyrinogen-III synthase [Shewanella sp. OPT22]